MRPGLLRAAAWTGRALSWAAVTLGAMWVAAALWFDGPASRPLAGVLAGGFLLGAAALAALAKPRWRALVPVAFAVAVVAAWWLSIEPSNDRDWQTDVSRLARTSSPHSSSPPMGGCWLWQVTTPPFNCATPGAVSYKPR